MFFDYDGRISNSSLYVGLQQAFARALQVSVLCRQRSHAPNNRQGFPSHLASIDMHPSSLEYKWNFEPHNQPSESLAGKVVCNDSTEVMPPPSISSTASLPGMRVGRDHCPGHYSQLAFHWRPLLLAAAFPAAHLGRTEKTAQAFPLNQFSSALPLFLFQWWLFIPTSCKWILREYAVQHQA